MTAGRDGGAALTWSDDLSVGHPQIDREHRELVALFGALTDPARHGDRAYRDQCLAALLSHVHVHFEHEEALMRRHGYPDAARHRDAHLFLLDQLNRFMTLARTHPDDVSDEDLLPFVASWLVDHIRGDDRALGAFLVAAGPDGETA